MSTFITFSPNSLGNPPFQTQVVLDGNTYTMAVSQNFYGQRWYIRLTDLSGNLIYNAPLVGSPADAIGSGISLVAGIFTSTLIFRDPSQQFEINP